MHKMTRKKIKNLPESQSQAKRIGRQASASQAALSPTGKLSKHDTLAHLYQFVDYVQDFIQTPKHLRKNLDMSVLLEKAKQCKSVLSQA